MPFFQVDLTSTQETKVFVEAENITAATVKAVEAVRHQKVQPEKPFFEEVKTTKLRDPVSVGDLLSRPVVR